MRLRLSALALTLTLFLTACGGGGDPTAVPDGWQTADGRWWRAGTDTSGVFRTLETLADMGIAERDQVFTTATGRVERGQFVRAVKAEMRAFFRHDPEAIDSLFAVHVREDVARAMSGSVQDLREAAEEQRDEAVSALRTYYREPRRTTSLGEDVQVVYPDSLRAQAVAGRVEMQLRLDAEGVPQAVKLVESVHPTLDAIAMRAATEMRWQPAYLKRDGQWSARPCFVRWNVRFRTPPKG
jgi:TonB family protein